MNDEHFFKGFGSHSYKVSYLGCFEIFSEKNMVDFWGCQVHLYEANPHVFS